jgi:BlaI family transcriptional regulator, penicillinase repressor
MKTTMRMTQAEWEVMAVVWQRQPTPASAVVEELHERRQWSLATVRTLLRRLVRKGALRQEIEGKRYLYTALVSMEASVRSESESFWDRVLGRAPSAALIHLVKRAELSEGDIQELKRILREKEK